jgi:hypothetical protein
VWSKAILNFWEWCCHVVKKQTLGLLAIIILIPTLVQFFKCTLEVMFCEGVQHHLRSALIT